MHPRPRLAALAAPASLAVTTSVAANEWLAPDLATVQAEQMIAAGDVEAAVPLLERAGRNWYPDADVVLGLLFLEGRGVERDPQRAVELLQRAARPNWMRILHKRGHPGAQHALAAMHASGATGKPDLRAAYRWHRAAARAGHGGSQLALARLYAAGHGVRSDASSAYRWTTIAAASPEAAIREEARELAESLRVGLTSGLAERIEREAARFQPGGS